MNPTSRFIDNFRRGKLCVHPTDTQLGLTCDLSVHAARTRLALFKQRDTADGYVHLASDFATAQKYWLKLPSIWGEILADVYPAPLTVIWRAVDANMHGTQSGRLAIRVPDLRGSWFEECLQSLQLIPSTSVNHAGATPMTAQKVWDSALRLDSGFYIPALQLLTATENEHRPSTIIALEDSGEYRVLRSGSLDDAVIRKYQVHASI
ncbi:MAG: Sua5/YciO/YrdC/YwlC family protein [Pseudomonadota bacterium]|nr:Sua5/YciO/YrdC/YwlC family protein [Pseudomonadota bacterium]